MKRFLLFAGDTYYPIGGWDDHVESFDNIEEAVARASEMLASTDAPKTSRWWNYNHDWAHVVDLEAGAVVWTEKDSVAYAER